jgi:hypothetical protein
MLNFEQEREIEIFLGKNLINYFNDFDYEMLKSDEIGHTHGPGVQKKVGEILSEKYDVTFECHKNGKKKKRAFSDNLIMGNPNNVKFGISVGYPNIVSMRRMINNVVEKNLIVYYLTIVFYSVITKLTEVKFVNILQFLDCLSFNAGTGQIMLKQDKFNKEYEKYLKGERKDLNDTEIQRGLLKLCIDEFDKHILLKQEQRDEFVMIYNRI